MKPKFWIQTVAASWLIIMMPNLLVPLTAAQPLPDRGKQSDSPEILPISAQETLLNPIIFNAPPNIGRPPGRRDGGGSRTSGNCHYTSDIPLTALAYSTEETTEPNNPLATWESVWTLTTSDYPTFWFYLPYELKGDIPVRFVLLDEQDNTVYRTTWKPTLPTEGILQVPTPDSLPPLQPGQRYHWYFIVECDQAYVEGWVQRTELPDATETALRQSSPRDQAAIYAAEGIWQDALTTLATLRLEQPSDPTLRVDWESFLDSGGLGELSDRSLVDCCSPESMTNESTLFGEEMQGTEP
jgi:hypothetical protein